MSISNAAQANILKLIFNATGWALYADNTVTSPQTNIALALHTADPTNAGTMSSSEIAYTSYVRASVVRTSGSTGWNVTGTSPTQAALGQTLSFAAGTGGSGTATYFSTGATGGGSTAILWSGTVTPNIVTGSGITPQLTTSTVCTLD